MVDHPPKTIRILTVLIKIHFWSKFGYPILNGWWVMVLTSSTRRSENDNIPPPQPKKNERITHSRANRLETIRSICHTPWPKVNPIVHPTSYPTHIPFIPSESTLQFQNSPWKFKVRVIPEGHIVGITPYRLISLSFDVDEPSHSYVQLFKNLKVTTWIQHSLDSHPFRCMSFGYSIPEIRLIQNLTLKIQGHGHGRGELWRSQHGPEHGSNIPSTHISSVPCQSNIQFPRYDFFKIWPWKSKVNVVIEVKVESHKVGVTSYRLTSLSFHVNRPFHPEIQNFLNLTLRIQGECEMTNILHNYRSRQFHITSNGINPSSGVRDMASTKSGSSAASLNKIWAMGKPIWDKWTVSIPDWGRCRLLSRPTAVCMPICDSPYKFRHFTTGFGHTRVWVDGVRYPEAP